MNRAQALVAARQLFGPLAGVERINKTVYTVGVYLSDLLEYNVLGSGTSWEAALQDGDLDACKQDA